MKEEILTLDSKDQIIIPSKMLKELSLNSEDKLVAYVSDDTIILKKQEISKIEKFDKAISETIKFAKENNITEKDINEEIKKYRKNHL